MQRYLKDKKRLRLRLILILILINIKIKNKQNAQNEEMQKINYGKALKLQWSVPIIFVIYIYIILTGLFEIELEKIFSGRYSPEQNSSDVSFNRKILELIISIYKPLW